MSNTKMHAPEVEAEEVTVSLTQIAKDVRLRLVGKGPPPGGEAILKLKFVS